MFGNDGSHNYLIFQPISNTITMRTDDTETIIARKSKGLSDEIIKPPITSGNSFTAKLKCIHNSKIAAAELKGSYVK